MTNPGDINKPNLIEAMARALIGDSRYEALPDEATYYERKSSGESEWRDKDEIHADMQNLATVLRKRGLINLQGLEILDRDSGETK